MTVPLDPFVWLYKTFDLERIEPYDELWMKDLVALDYIKRSRAFSGEPMTEKCWEDELGGMMIGLFTFQADVQSEYDFWSLHRPLSPVLTVKSIKLTPGPHKFNEGLNLQDHAVFLESHGIHNVEVEEVLEPPVKIEDVL